MRFDWQLVQIPQEGSQCDGAIWNSNTRLPFYMLKFHRDRLLRAAKYWNWQPAADRIAGSRGLETLTQLVLEVVVSFKGPLRIKICVAKDGVITIEKFMTGAVALESLFPPCLPIPGSKIRNDNSTKHPFTLLVDRQDIAPSEHTHFKTTHRVAYDDARKRARISPTDAKEVLVVHGGSVMEGSITTPYFWRDDKWVTPPVAERYSPHQRGGGQDGVTRRWALER